MKKIMLLLFALILLNTTSATAKRYQLLPGEQIEINKQQVIYSGVFSPSNSDSDIVLFHVQYSVNFIPIYVEEFEEFVVGNKYISVKSVNAGKVVIELAE